MQLQYHKVGTQDDAASIVVTSETGLTWSPASGAFIAGFPADSRIPLVRLAAHPGAATVVVRDLPESVVFVWLADADGLLIDTVPYQFVAEGGAYSAVLGPNAAPSSVVTVNITQPK